MDKKKKHNCEDTEQLRKNNTAGGFFMERHAFAMKTRDGKMNDYRKKLGEIWQELTAFLDRNEVGNFSIWNAEDLIFGYYEKKMVHS